MVNKYAVAQVSIVAPPEFQDIRPNATVGLPIPDSHIVIQFATAATEAQVQNARAALAERGYNPEVSSMHGSAQGGRRSIISISYDENPDTMREVCRLMGCRPPPNLGEQVPPR